MLGPDNHGIAPSRRVLAGPPTSGKKGPQAKMTELHRLVGSLQQREASLNLSTTDLCFLIVLHDRARRTSLAALEEEVLYDVYEQVCDFTEPGAGLVRKKATHALHRLRQQRLLGRVDGAGLVRAGEYALTQLARAIVDFFLSDEALTRESLTLLAATLSSQLAEIKKSAAQAHGPEDWSTGVGGPLQVTVSDLIAGIERRQLGMDAQQREVREQIGELLNKDWFAAVDSCEQLLHSTSATLQELNAVLLREATNLQAQLQEIEDLAEAAEAHEARAACLRAQEQVDRVVAWGGARLAAWSDYFQYVQHYLRSVVRLDPDRALSQRLREQLAGWPDAPFHLVVCEPARAWTLRNPDTRPIRPPVTRPLRDREPEPAPTPPASDSADLEGRVRQSLATARTLSEVLRDVLPQTDPPQRFVTVGRVAAQVAAEAHPRSERERPWVEISELDVEDWSLD